MMTVAGRHTAPPSNHITNEVTHANPDIHR